jgi:hypothetical protein
MPRLRLGSTSSSKGEGMNIEHTGYYDQEELDFNKTVAQNWRDDWKATPAEALKLCAMALSSMGRYGLAAMEFAPLAHLNNDKVKLVPGTDYHDRYLGVQGIGFVHQAYKKAMQQELQLELLQAQVREANQLLAEFNSYMALSDKRLGFFEQIFLQDELRKRLNLYLSVHDVSPAGV